MDLLQLLFPDHDPQQLQIELDSGSTIEEIIDQLLLDTNYDLGCWQELQTLKLLFPNKQESILYDLLLMHGMEETIKLMTRDSKPNIILLPKSLTIDGNNYNEPLKIEQLLLVFPMFDENGIAAALAKSGGDVDGAAMLLAKWATEFTQNPREKFDADLQTLLDMFPNISITALERYLQKHGSVEKVVELYCCDVGEKLDWKRVDYKQQKVVPVIEFRVESQSGTSIDVGVLSKNVDKDPMRLRQEANELLQVCSLFDLIEEKCSFS